ncbi:MAG: hypothetical protein J6M60_01335 [Clostridia bacterium]|nr:hypothetical protein [Clostridia bacterium]
MNFIKENFKFIIGFILGIFLASSATVYAYSYLAENIGYTKTNQDGSKTNINVQSAINELYTMQKNNKVEVVETGTYTSDTVSTEQYIQQIVNLQNTYTEDDDVNFIITNIETTGFITPYVDLLNSGNSGICQKVIGNTAKFYLNNAAGNASGTITINYAIVKIKD